MPAEAEAFAGERIPLRPVRRVHSRRWSTTWSTCSRPTPGRPGGGRCGLAPAAAPAPPGRPGVDGPVAEHGFSALVEVELADGGVHRLLFDTGVSPDGMVENMRRLGLAPDSVEAVVCSHGHFDHTTGLDGLSPGARRAANLPVVIHPEFWSRRRIALPGREPWELPATSRARLRASGSRSSSGRSRRSCSTAAC